MNNMKRIFIDQALVVLSFLLVMWYTVRICQNPIFVLLVYNLAYLALFVRKHGQATAGMLLFCCTHVSTYNLFCIYLYTHMQLPSAAMVLGLWQVALWVLTAARYKRLRQAA